jgi:hypothetical protein
MSNQLDASSMRGKAGEINTPVDDARRHFDKRSLPLTDELITPQDENV